MNVVLLKLCSGLFGGLFSWIVLPDCFDGLLCGLIRGRSVVCIVFFFLQLYVVMVWLNGDFIHCVVPIDLVKHGLSGIRGVDLTLGN